MSKKAAAQDKTNPRRRRFGRMDVNALMNANGAQKLVAREEIFEIPLNAIVADSPFQRRDPFDPKTREVDQDLIDSIREIEMIYAVGLTEIESGKFQVVYGHRRIAALRYLKKKTVRVYLIIGEESELATKTTVENGVVRQSSIHLAELAQLYSERYGYTNKQIAARLGCSKRHVKRLRELLKTEFAVQRALHDGHISAKVARAVGNASKEHQPRLTEIAVERSLTEADTRELVKHMKSAETDPDEAVTVLGLVFSGTGIEAGLTPDSSTTRDTRTAAEEEDPEVDELPVRRITISPGAVMMRLRKIFPDFDQRTLQQLAAAAREKGATWRAGLIAGLMIVGENEPFPPTRNALEGVAEALEMAIPIEDDKMVDLVLAAARVRVSLLDFNERSGGNVSEPYRLMYLSLGKLYTQLGEAGGLNSVEERK